MIIKNPWVGYLTRSYTSIKASILTRLKTAAPEITDYSETNILVIIVSIFSGVAEMLNYYIDAMARETFLATARKWTSIVKLVTLINYRIKASISASVDIEFKAVDSDGEPVMLLEGNSITIPMGTRVTNAQGIPFLTTRAAYISQGLYRVNVPSRQQVIVALFNKTTSNGLANQLVPLPLSYDDGTLYVEVGGVTWAYKEHLGFSGSSSTHFCVVVLEDGIPYCKFGDGVHGAIPTSGAIIAFAYRTTSGVKGNLGVGTITTLVDTLTIPVQDPEISEVVVTNPLASSGGLPIEDSERMRQAAPLHLRTLDRAVTYQDFIDVAKLAPSVNKAIVRFNCGKRVIIYVAPVGGGIASSALLAGVESYVEARKVIGLTIDAQAAGETFIGMEVVVTAKFRVNTNLVETDIKRVLVDNYSADNSDINMPIRTSDIISLIDNLEKVDYLDLVRIFSVPYARPYNNELQLDWDLTVLDGSVVKTLYRIFYTSSKFKLFKGTQFITDLTVNTAYTYQNYLTIKINSTPSGVADGYRWDFTVYAVNRDIILDDYTMPRIHPSFKYITLTVNEQSY
jgi:hypothetical protein